ncbi:hypothetical protein CKY47_34525 [Saccharothrix yanglingensis]|uniref:Uncharacterized protein n=1 Tax=Saccharothrix yanglingensis TaxID=659496 RepID=A0ABU0XA46_9PSEU|nr:hypothetical protein [Saccharothrix yanglingensis]
MRNRPLPHTPVDRGGTTHSRRRARGQDQQPAGLLVHWLWTLYAATPSSVMNSAISRGALGPNSSRSRPPSESTVQKVRLAVAASRRVRISGMSSPSCHSSCIASKTAVGVTPAANAARRPATRPGVRSDMPR